MTNDDDLGDKLLRYRTAKRIKQEALASDLGVTQATLSRWERGIQKPRGAIVQRIKALLVPSGVLLSEIGEALATTVSQSLWPACLLTGNFQYIITSPFLTELWVTRHGAVHSGSIQEFFSSAEVSVFETIGPMIHDPSFLGFSYNDESHLLPGQALRRSWTKFDVTGHIVWLQEDTFLTTEGASLDLTIQTLDALTDGITDSDTGF